MLPEGRADQSPADAVLGAWIQVGRRRPLIAAAIALLLIVGLVYTDSQIRFNAKREADKLLEERRVAAEHTESFQSLLVARDFLTKDNWTDAERELTKVQTRLADEKAEVLVDLAHQTEELLKQSRQIRAQEETRNSDRSRYQRFVRLLKEAQFREIQFTGLNQPAHRETKRKSAMAALAVFAAPGSGDLWRWRLCRQL